MAVRSRVPLLLAPNTLACHDGVGDGCKYFRSRRGVCSLGVLSSERLVVDGADATVWHELDSVVGMMIFDGRPEIEYSIKWVYRSHLWSVMPVNEIIG